MIQGLQNEYRHFYKSTEARVLISIEEEDQRFNLSNLLMESGYSVRMSRGAEESFATLTEFSPHLMVLSVQHLQELVELCREKDFLIYKPVLVVGGADVANQVQVNDYIPIEDFIEIPVPPKQMIAKVEKIFEQVIRQEEKSREMALFFEKSENHSKAGEIYRELGDYRKAAEMFETADAYGAAGEMYELLEDPKRAAKAYEMAGDYIKAAYFYTEAGMYEDRGRVYEKTGDYYYTAKNKLFQNDPDQALTYFRKVEPSHEKYRKACYYMAKIYVQRKEWAQAVKFYEKIVADEPIQANNIRHYYNLALAYEYLKQDSEALAIYEKILGVDYNFRDVYKRIERLRKKLQQVDQRTKMEQKVADFASVDQVAASSRSARYEKVKVIGRGGMGVVYEATDQVLGRKVALKVLSAAFREDKLVIDTFLREAKAAAMLNHVNIVTIFDAGVEANNYFIAMEMINGNTLKEIIQDRRFSIASVLRIMRQVCSGLKYAHSKKIIHRDLTNSNIMLTKDNIVKIMDFGLARIVEHLMSEQSIIGGTPSYMAPEQVQGAPIDHRADIYAIGINLFELCTGRLPFTKGDMGFHHVHTTPPNPRDFNSKITSELSDVILKCLEKLPENRFQSVEELMHALKF
jgi:tetratricopeptide (TPR) repeat protein